MHGSLLTPRRRVRPMRTAAAVIGLALVATLLPFVGTPATAETSQTNVALNQPVTASSGPYPGYEAGRAVDGVMADNNLWQSRLDDPAPWWQVELPDTVEVSEIGISFAGYQGTYYSVPEEITISVGEPGDLVQMSTISAADTPATGAPYSPQVVSFTLPEGAKGSVVRLDFPAGGKAGDSGSGSGNVALGEVQVLTSDRLDVNVARNRPAAASSDPYQGYDAGKAVDGAMRDDNLWQSRAGEAAPWWQVELPTAVDVSKIGISFAGYQGRYYGIPEEITISVGDPCDLAEVVTVPATATPSTGSPYSPKVLYFEVPDGVKGSVVRLDFPQGGKEGGNGHVALGEVQVLTPESQSPAPALATWSETDEIETITGDFGEVSIDVTHPQLTSLRLRQPDGSLGKSLVEPPAPFGQWQGGYTYLVCDGTRFDSRTSPAAVTAASDDGTGDAALSVRGITPRTATGQAGPVVEDWRFTVGEDGLEWEITQQWQRDAEVSLSGTPALFLEQLRANPDDVSAGITSTLWYQPDQLTIDGPETCPGYFNTFDPTHQGLGYVPDNVCQIVKPTDTWAIYKLFTDSHEQMDLRLGVNGGGHLYRRGVSHARGSEVGAVNESDLRYRRRAGDVDTTTLKISGADKSQTGRQLEVSTPDEATQQSLADLYGSMFNGGAVNNQATFGMGNQSEGYDWIGGSLFRGIAFAAGVQQPRKVSAEPFDLQGATRQYLDRVWSSVDDNGQSDFGYQPTPETLLFAAIATRSYVVATGDLESAQRWMPAIERNLAYFGDGIDETGLYRQPDTYAPCYYDYVCWNVDVKYSTYYQAFLYKALSDAAELEGALGSQHKAEEYRATAAGIKAGVNEVLWLPSAGGGDVDVNNTTWYPDPAGGWLPNGAGARYADWVDPDGVAHSNFIDIYQYPLIAFDIAPPDRAEEMLGTADKRMAELVERNGYTRECSLSALWPYEWDRQFGFGQYMNGGCLLASTYYEVVARAKTGDVDGQFGAYPLLQGYAQLFERTSFVGMNAANMQGKMASGSPEIYLSDAVMTPAALVDGIIGVEQSWDGLTADPHLPAGWERASATIQYKGALYHVKVRDGEVQISGRRDPDQ